MVAYQSLTNELIKEAYRPVVRASFTIDLKAVGAIAVGQAIANAEQDLRSGLVKGIDALKNTVRQDLAKELARTQDQIAQLEQFINSRRKAHEDRRQREQTKQRDESDADDDNSDESDAQDPSSQSGDTTEVSEEADTEPVNVDDVTAEPGNSAAAETAPVEGAEGSASIAPEGAVEGAGVAEGAVAATGGAEGAAAAAGAGEMAAAGGSIAGAVEGAEAGAALGPEGALIGAGAGLLASESGIDLGSLQGALLPQGGVGVPGGAAPELPSEEAPTEPMANELSPEQQQSAAGDLASTRNTSTAASNASKAAGGAKAAEGAAGLASKAGGFIPGTRMFLWTEMAAMFEDPSFISFAYVHVHPIAWLIKDHFEIFKILDLVGVPTHQILEKPSKPQWILIGILFCFEFVIMLLIATFFILIVLLVKQVLENAEDYEALLIIPGLLHAPGVTLLYNILAAVL
ncbi:MAG: hypothetical protein KIH62_001380 [Candidatus Kerfeldbacteria bacterium]|nr:hypothetical protein [Candidatus Kerfeldbacteria bacterium]